MKRLFALALFSLFLVLYLSACGSQDLVIVTKVVDGDTIKISSGETVRLIGIDTPETKHPTKPVEAYGREASEFTRKLVLGKQVYLEMDVQERDKYGRLLAYVYLKDGTFVNAELLKEGYARVMTVPPNVKYAETFIALEREARAARKGLWALEDQDDNEGKAPLSQGLIKGNINNKGEKIYHVPGGAYYDETIAEEYFETEEEAIKAGYRKAKK